MRGCRRAEAERQVALVFALGIRRNGDPIGHVLKFPFQAPYSRGTLSILPALACPVLSSYSLAWPFWQAQETAPRPAALAIAGSRLPATNAPFLEVSGVEGITW